MEQLNFLLLLGAGLLFTGLLLGTLSTRIGIPSLLVFLVLGMLAGEDGPGGIVFDDLELGFLISNLALAIILLDGGLRTRVDTFRVGLRPALTLATLGVVLTAMFAGAFATWLLDVDWRLGLLLGGIVGSTDAAAVFNVLKSAGLRLNERVASTLEVESGLNDPMAVFITVLVIEILLYPEVEWGLDIALRLVEQFGIGALLGVGLGAVLAELLLRVRSNEGLHALLLCAGGATLFAVTNMAGGSGFLAVYLAGLIAGNRRKGTSDNVLRAMDSMAWLAQSVMFLLLGLLVTPTELVHSLVPGIIIAFFLMLVARPVAVWLCLLPFAFNDRERAFVAWTGLRGAVPIVLAVFPLLAGVEETIMLFNITFVVVLASLLLQGSSVGWFARRLRVGLPPAAAPLKASAVEGVEDRYLAQFVVEEGSRAEGRQVLELLPESSARALCLVRDGAVLEPEENPRIRAGDHILWLCDHATQEQLGEWFLAASATLRRFYGDFTVRGTVLLSDIAITYGLAGVPAELQSMTLDELFRRQRRGLPVVGDTITLEQGLRLRVRALEGNHVRLVGIRLPRE